MPATRSRDAVLEDIAKVEGEVAEAQAKQDYQTVLEGLERILQLQRPIFSNDNESVKATSKRLWENYNFVATILLQQGDLRSTYELLKRAETLAEGSPIEKALTFNNLACYYRRAGKLRTALTYLEKALSIEEKVNGPDMAQTHLNLCATLSQLGRHERALFHAQAALIRMYETLCKVLYESHPSDEPVEKSTLAPALLDRVSVLCIAYHNLAVEHEYLKDVTQAMHAYKEGLRWAWRFLGEDHQICGIMKQAIGALSRGGKTGGKGGAGKAVPSFHGTNTTAGLDLGKSSELGEKHKMMMTPRDEQTTEEAAKAGDNEVKDDVKDDEAKEEAVKEEEAKNVETKEEEVKDDADAVKDDATKDEEVTA